jgi:hypothetical protein
MCQIVFRNQNREEMKVILLLSLASLVVGEAQHLERRVDDTNLFKPNAKGPAADLLNSSVQLSALFRAQISEELSSRARRSANIPSHAMATFGAVPRVQNA